MPGITSAPVFVDASIEIAPWKRNKIRSNLCSPDALLHPCVTFSCEEIPSFISGPAIYESVGCTVSFKPLGARLTWIELDNLCILKYLSAHYPFTLDEGKSREKSRYENEHKPLFFLTKTNKRNFL